MHFVSKTICFVVCFFAVLAMDFSLAKAQSIADFLPEQDLIEMLCLTSKWQANNLSALVGAYQEQKSDFQPIKTQQEIANQSDLICQSQTYTEALNGFNGFFASLKAVQAQLRDIDRAFQDNINERINGIMNKMSLAQKKSLANLVNKEKAKKEKELEALAEQLVKQAKEQLEQGIAKQDFPGVLQAKQYAFSITAQAKNVLENQVNDLALRLKTDLKQIAQAKAIEFLGKQVAGFLALTQESQKIKNTILGAYQAKTKPFEQDKINGFKKQAQLVNLFLDKEITTSKKQEVFSNEAKVSDELRAIQQIFYEKQAQALARASADDFFIAFSELKAGRQILLNQAPALFSKIEGASKFCNDNLPLLNNQKAKLVNLLSKIEKAGAILQKKSNKCRNALDKPECSQISDIANQLTDFGQGIISFNEALNTLNNQCAIQDEQNQQNILLAVNNVKTIGAKLVKDLALLKIKWQAYKSVI